MKTLILAGSVLLLTGCLGPEHFAREAGDRCLMAGYKYGTAQYNACSRVTARGLSRTAQERFSRDLHRGLNPVPYGNRYQVGVRYY